ncbi:hypothetical protein GCM10027168_21400 [Streptomyces capparidis]
MTVIRDADARRTRTPNAVMTTLASPTQGGSGLSVWRVEMADGQSGPVHTCDVEQVWTCLAGAATVEVGERAHEVAAGDTLVLPPGAVRRVRTAPGSRFAAVVAAPAGGLVHAPGVDVAPGCAVPRGDGLLPAWTA